MAIDLEEMFSYHEPNADQVYRYLQIREAARIFARVIVENTPASADQTAALRKVSEAMMTANAAVARDR